MTQKFTSDKPSIEEIRRLKKPPTQLVPIVMNSDLALEIEDLEERLGQAKAVDADSNDPAVAPALQAQLDELVERAKASVVEFELAALPRKRYDGLIEDHPPSAEQKADGFNINTDTFAPALLVACVTYPQLALSDAIDIWENWSVGEAQKLYLSAVAVNAAGEHKLPKSVSGTG